MERKYWILSAVSVTAFVLPLGITVGMGAAGLSEAMGSGPEHCLAAGEWRADQAMPLDAGPDPDVRAREISRRSS